MEEFFERLNKFHKKYSRYFLMILLIAAAVAVFYFLPYLIVLFLPFAIGWAVSAIASPLVKFLKNKLHVPYKVSAAITVLLLLTLLTLIVLTTVSAVSNTSDYIVENWEELIRSVVEYLDSAYQGLLDLSDRLPFDFMEMIDIDFFGETDIEGVSRNIEKRGNELISKLTTLLRPFAGNVASGTITVVKSLPEAIIFIIMLMLSTFFFTSGREKRSKWYEANISEKTRNRIKQIKTECFGAIWGTIRAYTLLSVISAVILFIGFLIMGIDNAAILAIIVAIVDLLPILGLGAVLIPWSIINFLAGGNIYVTVGMLLLYVICLVVRNVLQPKIVGEYIGIGPLASIISIWLGLKLYGFIGMIIVPIIATLIYKLYDIGMFDWFFLSHKKVTEERERIAAAKAEAAKKKEDKK